MTSIDHLQPLYDAALDIMDPHDPAREFLTIQIFFGQSQKSIYIGFVFRPDRDTERRAFGVGQTGEEALERFRSYYSPDTTTRAERIKARIAGLQAELERVEGGQG